MSDPSDNKKPPRLIRLDELMQRTGLSRSTIYNLMDPKSPRYDPTFPKRVPVSARTVAWVESEVDEWIEKRMGKGRKE